MISALAACILHAAAFNHEPPRLLVALLVVEGGRLGDRVADGDGSADLGYGQVNTFWLKEVAKASQQTEIEAERLLRWDGCFNIRTAAAILKYETDRASGDVWRGVANYHSHEAAEGKRYRDKVEAMGRKLYGDRLLSAG